MAIDPASEKINFKVLLGWDAKIIINRYSYFFCIPKSVALGSYLKRGDFLSGYYGLDKKGRLMLLLFLDGKDLKGVKKK